MDELAVLKVDKVELVFATPEERSMDGDEYYQACP